MTPNMELYFSVKRPRDFLEWTLQITPLAGGYILAQDQGRGQRPPDVLALGRSLREEGPRSPLLLVLQRLGGARNYRQLRSRCLGYCCAASSFSTVRLHLTGRKTKWY